jgi:hypothetical protein
LLQNNDRFWLFASLTRWNSTSWDNLSIFHASSLTGPWLPHAQNPVLLDARRSRGGGAPMMHNGVLLRPAQDCSRIYGGAITLNRIDVLNESDFSETEVGRIECGMLGCHTYNRGAGLETLDVFDARRRLKDVVAVCSLSTGSAETTTTRRDSLPEPADKVCIEIESHEGNPSAVPISRMNDVPLTTRNV